MAKTDSNKEFSFFIFKSTNEKSNLQYNDLQHCIIVIKLDDNEKSETDVNNCS